VALCGLCSIYISFFVLAKGSKSALNYVHLSASSSLFVVLSCRGGAFQLKNPGLQSARFE
jgi:hypothetical protein